MNHSEEVLESEQVQPLWDFGNVIFRRDLAKAALAYFLAVGRGLFVKTTLIQLFFSSELTITRVIISV